MYEIVKSYIVYTSKGVVILYIDEDGDIHSETGDAVALKEAETKYNGRISNERW